MTRAFFCEASDEQWLEAAKLLRDEHQWQVVGWSGSGPNPREYAARISREIRGALHHDTYEAVRGIAAWTWRDRPLPAVDPELLRDLAEVEWEALRMMNRLELVRGTLHHEERIELYQRLVRYWSAVLDELRPDVLVHPTAPHLVYDFVLHELARRRGIKTVLFERTWSPGQVLVVDDMRAGPKELPNRYAQLQAEGMAPVVADATRQELERLRRSYGEAVSLVHRHKMTTTDGSSLAATVRRRMASFGRRAAHPVRSATNALRPHHTSYGKVPGRPLDRAWPNTLHFRLAEAVGNRQKRALRSTYERLVSPPGGNFIYLPLHFQPERTTSPLGGRFVDPLVMVGAVAAALPAGWKLVVREHPLTLRPATRGHLARSPRLYEDLAALHGVLLAPLEADPFDLIDRSRAVATVTGSTGWEALARGKPVIVLGPAWYASCRGAYRTHTVDEIREALDAIMSSHEPDPIDVERFAQAADEVSHDAFTATILAGIVGESAATSGRTLADAIAAWEKGTPTCFR